MRFCSVGKNPAIAGRVTRPAWSAIAILTSPSRRRYCRPTQQHQLFYRQPMKWPSTSSCRAPAEPPVTRYPQPLPLHRCVSVSACRRCCVFANNGSIRDSSPTNINSICGACALAVSAPSMIESGALSPPIASRAILITSDRIFPPSHSYSLTILTL